MTRLILLLVPALLAAQERPASSYQLGPEDEIVIRAVDVEEITDKLIKIDLRGQINLPMVGRIDAAGLTTQQLEVELATRLKKFVHEPQVMVAVAQYRSQPVTVLGAVTQPGTHQLQGRRTLYELLSMVGGLRNDAGDTITIQRQKERGALPLPGAKEDATGRFLLAEVNAKSLLSAKEPQDNIEIKPFDVISVQKAEIFYVLGEVIRPGGFVLDQAGPLSLLQALTTAGGPQKFANLAHARILRFVAGSEMRQQIPVDLKKVLEGKSEDIRMRPEDVLYIPHNTTKEVAVRALEAAAGLGTGIALWRVGNR